ncbi:MAG: sigma-70 family RNA polymerase sigma factor, partial [Gemmatimonadaceae bacterium]|nr:sigma-70 family RNA polymerase sigma factor [Gemmatimonadaceae bacterium]
MTDADLLARLRSGEHDAFDALFRQWYEPVVRVAHRILRDQGVAEEVTQDVFLELWRRRDSLPDGSSVPAYLMQSARNRALNHLRHLKVQQKSQVFLEALHEPSVAADTEARSTELIAAIHEAVTAQPPRTPGLVLCPEPSRTHDAARRPPGPTHHMRVAPRGGPPLATPTH